ncbi:SDR family NAD(P)-dependent oxidoreductase, partial [Rhizobium ruizarguesonis]
MKLCLEGKIAILTCAGSGIGAAVSRHLADEVADVVVADINADAAHTIAAAIRSEGGRANFGLHAIENAVQIDVHHLVP